MYYDLLWNRIKILNQVEELRGGVCGGSLIHGILKLDQEIEIRPGVSRRDEEDPQANEIITPIKTKIMSLKSDKNSLQVFLSLRVQVVNIFYSVCSARWSDCRRYKV